MWFRSQLSLATARGFAPIWDTLCMISHRPLLSFLVVWCRSRRLSHVLIAIWGPGFLFIGRGLCLSWWGRSEGCSLGMWRRLRHLWEGLRTKAIRLLLLYQLALWQPVPRRGCFWPAAIWTSRLQVVPWHPPTPCRFQWHCSKLGWRCW